MNQNIDYEKLTARCIEFHKIKEIWTEYALTEGAKKKIKDMVPSLSESGVKTAQRETSEARLLLEKAGNPPLTAMEGMCEIAQLAGKGVCLTVEQLEKGADHLTAVRRLKEYLNRCKMFETGLPYYEENLEAMPEVCEEIHEKLRGGKVDDYASKLLKNLRAEIQKLEEKMMKKAEGVLKKNQAYFSEQFCTTRNGRICVPVKKEYRQKVVGSVVDKSSTGNTLFIEPAEAGACFEELSQLRMDEENEVRRILYELSSYFADAEEIMEENVKTIEKLDFIFSKGKLSLHYDGTEPEIHLERYIRIHKGRHPLMEKEKNVPLEFEIGRGTNGVIITGPNTGGKTVAIKTVALNCYMAQCGLHVAAEEAEICMNSQYLCDIGDGQNLSENLSTFSAHITNVLKILQRAGRESLVIMDELGSGTDPAEGMGIAIAILKELKKSGAIYLVTTHYPEVKQYAKQEEGVVNARMTFDKESLKPLYQLVIGEAGESCAFHIAKKLGMPEEMLREAKKAAYGVEYGTKEAAGAEETGGRNAGKSLAEAGGSEDGNKGKGQNVDSLKAGQKNSTYSAPRIQKAKKITKKQEEADRFQIGDSVMVYPDKKIGIVCKKADRKGMLGVQMPDKKITINHKRVKLHVAAGELYPEDYDFSILFDTVENRKARHQMEKHHMEGVEIHTGP